MIPSKILAHLGQKLTRARQLGSYRLVEQIGRGGMGEVWRAEHRLFARPAAIKLITAQRLEEASSVAEERFRREAQAAAALRSPHTIQLYDFGLTRDRRPYYVMELLDGCDLESLVRRYGAQPAARVVVHPSPGVPLAGGGARSRAGAPRHQARQPPYRAARAGLRLREGAGLRAGEAAARTAPSGTCS